jgi:quercetin dioxygenase-like cupin family protein
VKFAKYDRLGSTPVRSGVTRKVFTGDGATLAWTTLEPGHTPYPHAHAYEQIVYVVSGRLRFTVGGDVTVLDAGDMIVVPPDVEHYAETLGEEPAVDLSIFTPRRDDYAAQEQLL